jgi:hypothetical protein
MTTFTFGGPLPPSQNEEANDNPEIIGEIQNLQIADNLQVAAGGVAQDAGGGVGVVVGGAAGGAAGAQFIPGPVTNYHSNPLQTNSRKNFFDFNLVCRTVLTFGAINVLSCGPTSNNLKLLISRLHMQYLWMVDSHILKTNNILAVNGINKFLFETSVAKLHPTQGTELTIYKNFRDYIFKPVFLACYATSLESVPDDLVEGADKMRKELFRMWLTCNV